MSTDAAKEALISLKDKFTLSPIEKHVYYSIPIPSLFLLTKL